jgi:adenylate cyclase
MSSQTDIETQWHDLVFEGKPSPERMRVVRFYSMLPSSARCRICLMPFAGITGQVFRLFGRSRSTINPRICSACDVFIRMNPGGVEVRLSMLFADIRGSTGIAEQKSPTEFRHLIDRFFAAATDVLGQSDAIIDKLAGDQVSAYFLPGLAGSNHASVAIGAAQRLLQATGNGDPSGPWIPVGIGVHTGEAFFGSVGSPGGIVDVTALGDAVNVAARLASNAGPGEILVSQETLKESGLEASTLPRRSLALKGRAQPVSVSVLNA